MAAILIGAGLWSQTLVGRAAPFAPVSRTAAVGTDVSPQQTLINQDRAANGLPPLLWSSCLAAVAVQNAQRIMSQAYLSHTNAPRLNLDCGVSANRGGENIAYRSGGIDDPAANTMFMNSPPHRDNIMGAYQYVGTAWSVAPNGYGYIAVEFLGAADTLVPGGYQPLAPVRVLDTRDGTGGVPIARVGPGGTLTVQLSGRGGVPSTRVASVALNVAVTNTTSPSFLTIYPAEDPRPDAANLNWVAGQTVANFLQVALRGSGQLNVYNPAGYTDVIFDVAGYVPAVTGTPGAAGLYQPLVPFRILDTRDGTGGFTAPVLAGTSINLQVTGRGGVPASGVSAVVLNLAVTDATAASFVTVYPSGSARPVASNLNFVAGQTVPNRVIAKLGANGQVSLFNAAGQVHLVVDVGGWFTDGSNPMVTGSVATGVTPFRILDTRDGRGGYSSRVGPGGMISLAVAGHGGVPLMTSTSPVPPKAVVINVTVTNPSATSSYLTIYPSGALRPLASDLNFVGGQTVPNLVVVGLGGDGNINIYNVAGMTDVIADVVAWYG